MARRITQKSLKQDEFVDAAVDASHWIEKNWKLVAMTAVGGFVVVLASFGWITTSRKAAARTEEVLAQVTAKYERLDSSQFADTVEVDALLSQLDGVVDEAGNAASGWTARYLRGVTLYRIGRYDEASAILQQVADSEAAARTLRATARAMLAETFVAAGRDSDAVDLLNATLADDGSLLPADETLQRLARIHEDAGRTELAREMWQRIVDEFPQSPSAAQAKQQLGS